MPCSGSATPYTGCRQINLFDEGGRMDLKPEQKKEKTGFDPKRKKIQNRIRTKVYRVWAN